MDPPQTAAVGVKTRGQSRRSSASTASANTQAAASTGNTSHTSITQTPSGKAITRKKTKAPSPLAAPPVTDLDIFLIALYADLNRVCTGVEQPDIHKIRALVRKGIVLTTIEDLDHGVRDEYRIALENLDPDTQVAYNTAQSVLHDLDEKNDALNARIANFTGRLGFLLWSICLHSSSFRETLEWTTCDTWDELARHIAKKCAGSLELFARTRGLDWRDPITFCNRRLLPLKVHIELTLHRNNAPAEADILQCTEDDIHERLVVPEGRLHSHEWVLSNHGRGNPATRPVLHYTGPGGRHRTADQVNIADSELISQRGGHNIWPQMRKWPIADPRYLSYLETQACGLCDDGAEIEYGSQCEHTRSQFLRELDIQPDALVELVNYGSKGTGVRALSPFSTGDLIGEYIGEIYPHHRVAGSKTKNFEPLYAGPRGVCYRYEQDINPREFPNNASRSRFDRDEYATFVTDPARKGNWTRYMNHSCRSHTNFVRKNVHQRERTFVEVTRDIRFGEEITVNYQAAYFGGRDAECYCREDCCTLWRRTTPPNTMTLGEARRAGQAPPWAVQRLRLARPRPDRRTTPPAATAPIRDETPARTRPSKENDAATPVKKARAR